MRLRPKRSPSLPPSRISAANDEDVGVDRPLEVLRRRVQRALDRRQRHVHDRVVEHDHEQGEAHGEQRPPLVVRVIGRSSRTPLASCRGSKHLDKGAGDERAVPRGPLPARVAWANPPGSVKPTQSQATCSRSTSARTSPAVAARASIATIRARMARHVLVERRPAPRARRPATRRACAAASARRSLGRVAAELAHARPRRRHRVVCASSSSAPPARPCGRRRPSRTAAKSACLDAKCLYSIGSEQPAPRGDVGRAGAVVALARELVLGRVEDRRAPVLGGESDSLLDHEERQVSEDSLRAQTGGARRRLEPECRPHPDRVLRMPEEREAEQALGRGQERVVREGRPRDGSRRHVRADHDRGDVAARVARVQVAALALEAALALVERQEDDELAVLGTRCWRGSTAATT